MGQLGGSKQLGSTVRTGSHTGAAANTHGGIHRCLGGLLRYWDKIGVRCAPGVDGDVTTSLNDPIEGAPIHH